MDIDPIRRVNYAATSASQPNCLNGPGITSDFKNYHIPLTQLLNRAIHRGGVAMGLDLGGVGTSSVTVAPGVAIDRLGQVIVLPSLGKYATGDSEATRTTADMPATLDATTFAGKSAFVTIRFLETSTGKLGNVLCDFLAQTPWLRLEDAGTFHDSEDVVILGRATISAGGQVGELAGPRQTIGVAAGTVSLRGTVSQGGSIGESAVPSAVLSIGPGGSLQVRVRDGTYIAQARQFQFTLPTATGFSFFSFEPMDDGGVRLKVNDSLLRLDANSLDFVGAARFESDVAVAGSLQVTGTKNFVVPHPADSAREIVYSCLEGPEAAVYVRGRARLARGVAEVAYPEHFAHVVNPETVTVQLTPRSASSAGLAVVDQSAAGFNVRELADGSGSYDFDYHATGVRRGYEGFTPTRPRGPAPGADRA